MEIDTELLAALQEEASSYSYPGLPTIEEGVTAEWFSIPRGELEALIAPYIEHIELSPTAEVCKCTWLIHPDDLELPPVKQRKKRSIEHPRCMVHSKLGFLLGFFAFTFPEPEGEASAQDG